MVEEEIIVGGNGSHQAVLKSGPKKPKLENVALAQWCVANNAILFRLISESKLNPNDMLDYIYYSCGKFPGDFSSQISLSELGSHQNWVHPLPPVRLHLIIIITLSLTNLSIEIFQLLLTL